MDENSFVYWGDGMIQFIGGVLLGGLFGVGIMALMIAGREGESEES